MTRLGDPDGDAIFLLARGETMSWKETMEERA